MNAFLYQLPDISDVVLQIHPEVIAPYGLLVLGFNDLPLTYDDVRINEREIGRILDSPEWC